MGGHHQTTGVHTANSAFADRLGQRPRHAGVIFFSLNTLIATLLCAHVLPLSSPILRPPPKRALIFSPNLVWCTIAVIIYFVFPYNYEAAKVCAYVLVLAPALALARVTLVLAFSRPPAAVAAARVFLPALQSDIAGISSGLGAATSSSQLRRHVRVRPQPRLRALLAPSAHEIP